MKICLNWTLRLRPHVYVFKSTPFSKVSVFARPHDNAAFSKVSVFESLHWISVCVWTEGENEQRSLHFHMKTYMCGSGLSSREICLINGYAVVFCQKDDINDTLPCDSWAQRFLDMLTDPPALQKKDLGYRTCVFCLILHFLNIYSILQFNVLTNHFLSQSSKLRWVELHCPLQTCPLKKENHLHVTSLIFHIQFSNLLIYSIRQLRSVMWMGSDTTSKTLHQTLVFLHQILVFHLH